MGGEGSDPILGLMGNIIPRSIGCRYDVDVGVVGGGHEDVCQLGLGGGRLLSTMSNQFGAGGGRPSSIQRVGGGRSTSRIREVSGTDFSPALTIKSSPPCLNLDRELPPVLTHIYHVLASTEDCPWV
jgi:hypothetical protein